MFYPIAIETGDDSTAYGVIVPDIEGCFSAGDTLDEAVKNAREAIDFHLEALAEEEIVIPKASTLDVISKSKEFEGYTLAVVDIDISKYLGPSKKINVTLPVNLIHRIDSMVDTNKQYKTRSGFLQEAALKALSAN